MFIDFLLPLIVIFSMSVVGGSTGAFLILRVMGFPWTELWKFLNDPIPILWRDV